jgi:methylthioribose-1-phosphate isomerase
MTASPYKSIQWIGDIDGHLRLLDQTQLPVELSYLDCFNVETVWEAIQSLRVRGAPAIGIAAAYGIAVGAKEIEAQGSDDRHQRFAELGDYLASSRPTAVNLFWAIERMKAVYQQHHRLEWTLLRERLLAEARQIHQEDIEMCHAIGRYGASLLKTVNSVLTHCNTGGLATSEYGTALSVIFTCQDQGHRLHVFVDETRPLLQGARLTAWELMGRGIDCTLICDSMAAQVMREGRVQAVIVGADRIAANGDTANKIGTYGLAVLAKAHNVPFYVAAPSSTFDLSIESGDQIPIELRNAKEITEAMGRQISPVNVSVYNPAFDVTPATLISAIITERGQISPVDRQTIAENLRPA